jgi:hypothetical protein
MSNDSAAALEVTEVAGLVQIGWSENESGATVPVYATVGDPRTRTEEDREEAYRLYENGTEAGARAFLLAHHVKVPASWAEDDVFDVLSVWASEDGLLIVRDPTFEFLEATEVEGTDIDKLAALVAMTGGRVVSTVRYEDETLIFYGPPLKYHIPREAVPAEELGEERAAPDEATPIPLEALGTRFAAGRHVIQDLVPDGQLVTIVGEEGEGKSTLAWQIACEVSSGEPVGGHFEVPEPVAPVLIVDVEQSEEDAVILRDDMLSRGLDVSGVLWLDANGRSLDVLEDQLWLSAHVRAQRPKLIILDTGTEAVTKPREDESVKLLFILLHRYLKAEGVRAVLMLAQPRKRSQDAPSSRRFDDLFGSRVWKGRSSAVLYLEQQRLTVWKQRGGYLRRRWGGSVGRIERSDTGPTKILEPKAALEAETERRALVLSTVALNPGAYSKTSLIEEELHINGHDRDVWRKTVDALTTEGKVHADGRYNRLYPAPSAPSPPVESGRSLSSTNL